MNFENMPELDWHWGYPFGLGVIVISAILPLIWFKPPLELQRYNRYRETVTEKAGRQDGFVTFRAR